jgi:hypothetical protein
VSRPRCDGSPWGLPRERDPDELDVDHDRGRRCDDDTENDDLGDYFTGREVS